MDSDGQLRAVEDAAVCIQKAVDGKALGASVGEAPFLHRFQLHAFRVRHKYNVLFRLASWGMIFITIFQRPSWSYQDTYCSTWRNSDRFPSFSNAYFYIEEVTASYLSLFFLLVLLVAIVLELMYRSSEYLYIHVDGGGGGAGAGENDTSLRFTSLHFTSLHFTSQVAGAMRNDEHHFASPNFTSLRFTSIHFPSNSGDRQRRTLTR